MNNGMPTPTVEGKFFCGFAMAWPSMTPCTQQCPDCANPPQFLKDILAVTRPTPATPAAQEEMPTHSAECSNSNGACFCGLEGRLRSRLQQEIAARQAAEREREATIEECARVCESFQKPGNYGYGVGIQLADAIRALSKQDAKPEKKDG